MKITYNIILLALPFLLAAQAPPIEWQKAYGGLNYDSLGNLKQTPDGGFIFIGKSESFISGDKTVGNKGEMDIWVIKTNSDRAIQWQKDIGGNAYDDSYPILLTTDGGYLIGGESESNISGDKTENSNGFWDIWLLKLDSQGNIEWQNTIGGSYSDGIRSIVQTPDGGYMIGASSVSGISGDKTEDNIGWPFGSPYYTYFDYWLVKIDAIGNVEWDNTIGSKMTDFLSKVIMASDGGYLVVGYSQCDNTGDYIGTPIGGYDLWILKLDLDGNIIWQKTIGGTTKDESQSVISTSDGGYLLGAVSNSNISGNKSENSKGGDDFWIVKIDSMGNVLWDKTIGGSGADVLYSMTKDNNDNFYLLGPSSSNISGDKTQNSRGGKDFWVVKTDSSGNILWDKTIGGFQDDEGGSIEYLANDDSIIVGGQSYSSASGDKTEISRGDADYWVVKLSSDNLTKTSFGKSGISIYPNPTTKTIHVDLPQTSKNVNTSITTITGQIIQEDNFKDTSHFQMDMNAASGIYFLNIANEKNEKFTFKMVKE